MKRRDFFKEMFEETLREAVRGATHFKDTLYDVSDTVHHSMEGTAVASGKFFDSYELSYSLTLAYPREMFEQMAKSHGIEYKGIETIELAKELNRRGVI